MSKYRISLHNYIRGISDCVSEASNRLDKEKPDGFTGLTIRTFTVRFTARMTLKKPLPWNSGGLMLDFAPRAANRDRFTQGELVFTADGSLIKSIGTIEKIDRKE